MLPYSLHFLRTRKDIGAAEWQTPGWTFRHAPSTIKMRDSFDTHGVRPLVQPRHLSILPR